MSNTLTVRLTRDRERELIELREVPLRLHGPDGPPTEALLGLAPLPPVLLGTLVLIVVGYLFASEALKQVFAALMTVMASEMLYSLLRG